MPRPSGTHFLQIPGPTNVPERILRAMARPTIDHRSAEFSRLGLEHFNMSLGNGLGKVQRIVFRIGHLGDFNDLMLAEKLSGVEMGLALAGVPHSNGGVAAALDYLTQAAARRSQNTVAAVP